MIAEVGGEIFCSGTMPCARWAHVLTRFGIAWIFDRQYLQFRLPELGFAIRVNGHRALPSHARAAGMPIAAVPHVELLDNPVVQAVTEDFDADAVQCRLPIDPVEFREVAIAAGKLFRTKPKARSNRRVVSYYRKRA